MNKFWGHFKTITSHKFLVMKYCFKVGLYKQGLLHDLSKYSWTEFKTGIKYYKGVSSPNGEEKRVTGISKAWLHHKGRNKHHFEYWIDYTSNPEEGLKGMKMPVKYVVEMFIDRMSACKNYQGDKYTQHSPLEYYNKRKDYYIIEQDSRRLLEELLETLDKKGEKYTIKYIKDEILRKK